MTARVLVVDDVLPNIRLLEARLSAEYFDALQAPQKLLAWFEHSAHDVPFDEPEEFVKQVTQAAKRMPIDQ